MEHDVSLLHNTAFWYAMAFVAFFVLAGKAVFKAITGWLDGKIAKIRTDIDEAARLRAEAESLLQEAKARHAAASKEAGEIMEGATREAELTLKRMDEETKRLIERREQQVVERLALAEQQAMDEVRKAAVGMALKAAEKALAGKMNGETQTKLADAAIKDLGKAA